MIDEIILTRTMELAEEFFGTQKDPSQIPISFDSYHKLIKLWPGAFVYEMKNEEPVSWGVAVPTSIELMNRFLKKEITERQLLDYTQPVEIYDCLYLCSVFTLPAFRRQGLALKLLLQLIKTAPLSQTATLFAWPTTEEGEAIINRVEQETGQKVIVRSAG